MLKFLFGGPMKKTLLFCLASIFIVLCMSTLTPADTLQVREYAVTATTTWETTPRLGTDGVSDLVVFTQRSLQPDGSMGKGDIWFQRLASDAPFGAAVQVTSGTQDNQLNDVSGDYIVYTSYDSTSSLTGRIMVYQISTTILHGIESALIMQEPRISGNKVVWREGGANAAMVMLYDLSWLGTAHDADIIAGPIPPTFNVDIGDRFVVWAERTTSDQDIFAYDLAAGVRIRVTATPTVIESEPSTSGAWIVWQAQDKGVSASRIVAKNIDTSEERVIADGGVFNFRPSMDADLVAWESMLYGNLDIFIYRLSTSETFRVTNGGVDHYLNDVFGNNVAYVDQRSGNEDIYVSHLEFIPANQPPEAVDDLVSVSSGLVSYDRRTGQFSTNITVKNTSTKEIGEPVWLVIDGISNPGVTLASPDETTADGKPYFDLSSLLGDGKLSPGETISKRVYFNNPSRVKFTFTPSVRGII